MSVMVNLCCTGVSLRRAGRDAQFSFSFRKRCANFLHFQKNLAKRPCKSLQLPL